MRLLFNLPESAGTRVIDTNDVIEALLAQRKEEKIKEEAHEEIARTEDESGFTEGLVFAPLDPPKPAVDYEGITKEEAKRIVDAAQERAAQILMDAKALAEAECDQIRKNAYDDGFNQGIVAGKAQMDEMAAENQEKFNAELSSLQAEYNAKFEEIERDVVGATATVFENVFGIELSGSEAVLEHLVKNTLYEVDSAKEFHIRVSKDDAEMMKSNLDTLKSCVSSECFVEVLADNTLEKGQCLIETEHGIFDCGANIQLANIIRNLKALAN